MQSILLASLLASVSAWDVSIPAELFTSSVFAGPSPSADPEFFRSNEANFCPNPALPGSHYWCMNGVVKPVMSSLSFDVNFPADGIYNVGIMYSATMPSTIQVQIDDQGSFGQLNTPTTNNWNALALGNADTSAAVTAGVHTLKLTITTGSFHVTHLLLGDAVLVAPQPYILPLGSVTIPAQNFISSSAPQPFVPSLLADASFFNATQINFCQNAIDNTQYDWCYNSPVLTVQSSLTFSYTFPVTGNYYFGVSYACSNATMMTVALDNSYGAFGSLTTPITGSPQAFALSSGSLGALIKAGTHKITTKVLKGNMRVNQIVISSSPLTMYLPYFSAPTNAPTTPTTIYVAPTQAEMIVTTSGQVVIQTTTNPVSQNVKVAANSNSNNIVLTPGAVVGIVIGGVVFLIALIAVTVFIVRKNNSDVNDSVREAVGITPRTKKMVDGTSTPRRSPRTTN